MSAPPPINEAERSVARILSALHFAPYFGLQNHALRFEVRTRWDKGQEETTDSLPRSWWKLNIDGCEVAARHALAASAHYGVYISCLPRIGRSGKSEDVPFAAALWASVDDKTPGGALSLLVHRTQEGLPAPHLAIASGGGVHAMWLLENVVNLTEEERRYKFRSALRRLALKIGENEDGYAETNADYLSYMIRCPYSLNHKAAYVEKDGGPRRVRLLRFAPDAPKYPLVWWLARLPSDPREKEERERREKWKDYQPPDRPAPLPEDVENAVVNGCAAGQRHKVAIRIGSVAAARGYAAPSVTGLLERFAASAGWTPEKKEIANIVKKYCRAA